MVEQSVIWVLFIAGLGLAGEPVGEVRGPYRTEQGCYKAMADWDFALHDKTLARTLRCDAVTKPRGVMHPDYMDGPGAPAIVPALGPRPRVHS